LLKTAVTAAVCPDLPGLSQLNDIDTVEPETVAVEMPIGFDPPPVPPPVIVIVLPDVVQFPLVPLGSLRMLVGLLPRGSTQGPDAIRSRFKGFCFAPVSRVSVPETAEKLQSEHGEGSPREH
jgi:hypothetical protein